MTVFDLQSNTTLVLHRISQVTSVDFSKRTDMDLDYKLVAAAKSQHHAMAEGKKTTDNATGNIFVK